MKAHIMLSAILLIICGLYSEINLARGYHGGHYGHRGNYYGHGGYHGRSGFRFYFNAPFYPFYYPHSYYPYSYQPFYYPPAVVTIPETPPVYIQQPVPADQQYPAGYWYYCTNPGGYYPNIKECPEGWLQVKPIPSTPR